MSTIPPERWEDMQLKAHPSAHCLVFSWNVVEFWQTVMNHQSFPEPEQFSSQENWVLWRKELTSRFALVPREEAWAIDALLHSGESVKV